MKSPSRLIFFQSWWMAIPSTSLFTLNVYWNSDSPSTSSVIHIHDQLLKMLENGRFFVLLLTLPVMLYPNKSRIWPKNGILSFHLWQSTKAFIQALWAIIPLLTSPFPQIKRRKPIASSMTNFHTNSTNPDLYSWDPPCHWVFHW